MKKFSIGQEKVSSKYRHIFWQKILWWSLSEKDYDLQMSKTQVINRNMPVQKNHKYYAKESMKSWKQLFVSIIELICSKLLQEVSSRAN